MIASHLENIDDNHHISVIGQGMQKYLTLSLCKILTFKHSLKFQGASLEQIGIDIRARGMDPFRHLRAEFAGATNEQLDLLLRKKVYAYEYMDSWDHFIEPASHPKRRSTTNYMDTHSLMRSMHIRRRFAPCLDERPSSTIIISI